MSKITRLQASNFKRLTAIDIQPGGGIVPIRGRNAQGKSSTLDAIQAALGGTKAAPSRPVRKGEDEAAIRLELDNGMVITRRFTADGKPTLEVTNGDGFKAGSPQQVLDKLYTSVAFDPLAFTRLKPEEQLKTLRVLVGVDTAAAEKAVKDAYDARTEKNRELDRERARLEQMPHHKGAPAEPVDETALDEQIAGASEANAALERRKLNREDFARRLQNNRAALVDLQTKRSEIERLIVEFSDAIADQEQQLANAEPLADPVDVTELQEKQRAARATNDQVRANRARAVQAQLVETLEGEAKALTLKVEEGRQLIADKVAAAQMPVPGLSFGDGEVLLNELPLDQASAAEQLRLSTAIGMASAPQLHVMLVRDGSLLDPEGEKILADMAAEHDFQLWVEAVDPTGAVGIVIEDGAVASIDGEPAPEPELLQKPKRRGKKAEQEEVAEQAREVLTPAADAIDAEPPLEADGFLAIDHGISDEEKDPPFDVDPADVVYDDEPAAKDDGSSDLFD